jgi:hypothetical protein
VHVGAGDGDEGAVRGGVGAFGIWVAGKEADGEEAARGGEGGEVRGVVDEDGGRPRTPLAPGDYARRFPFVGLGALQPFENSIVST